MNTLHKVFDKNKYDQKYAKEHFDRLAINVPKGQKEKIKNRANELGLNLNEYIRELINQDLNSTK